MILFWKGTSAPIAPLSKEQGQITPSFHRFPASLKLPVMLLCKGTCASVAPLSKGRESLSPSCTPVPTFLAAFVLQNKCETISKMQLPQCGFTGKARQRFGWNWSWRNAFVQISSSSWTSSWHILLSSSPSRKWIFSGEGSEEGVCEPL